MANGRDVANFSEQMVEGTAFQQMENISLRAEDAVVHGNERKWDVYDEAALEFDDSIEDKTIFTTLVKLLKVIFYLSTFVVVLTCGVISKGSLLFMTSAIGNGRTFPICNNFTNLERDNKFAVRLSEDERYSWIWCLLFALFIPEILTFIRSSRLCIFKKYHKPKISSFVLIFVIESLNTVGLTLLVFVVFPEIHLMKALSLANAVCLVPAVFNLYFTWKSFRTTGAALKNILNLFAVIFQASIFVLTKNYWRQEFQPQIFGLVSVLLISCSWWENFVNEKSHPFFAEAKKDIEKSRSFIYIFISLWKIAFTFGLCLFYLFLSGGKVYNFLIITNSFQTHNVSVVWPPPKNISVDLKPPDEMILNIESSTYLPIATLVIHVFTTFLCYSTSKFACKVCMQQFSFSLPLCLVVPGTMQILSIVCDARALSACAYSKISPYVFWIYPEVSMESFFVDEFGFLWILWFISQIFVTIHTWFPRCERMASTNKLFVNPMYSTVLIDQSLVLNRRKYEKENSEKEELIDEDLDEAPDDTTRIFACATMWHETPDEMEQLLKSIMRMDVHQCSQAIIQDGILVRNPDYYELQAHIFFDDAFVISDEDDEKRTINSFVKDLIVAVDTAASKIYKKCSRPDPPLKVPTPYGGQLVWRLLGDNFLVVHLKDKELIRHKKRWSQVMYMYYLLGYGLEYKMSENVDVKVSRDKLRQNTFILALDGDIDFKPSAVQLLVDLMKRNKNLGAACGRIHPVGTGLMVYYQKFEYAIGHWLQKSTEHMIGCVLCSPGCFSLFRAEALLKKNTIRTYSTKAREAIEYVQFDQGEDRWLCTLLLQRGYRVEYSAASDAYTHCPETFGEFYTQRRRWAPSTMANIMDLLLNYQKTVKCNDNISRPYIAYQILLMMGTILGPGTIFLMLVGAMVSAFGISNWQAFVANLVPIVFFILICFHTKNDTQIFIAQIFSALYALLMMAVLVGISLQLVIDGITSPSGIFIISMTASFVIAALAHPQEFWCVIHGIIYFLSVPSMYLLLALYSFINLHVVSWGTREVQTKKSKKQLEAERLLTQVAIQPKSKGGMFDWINALGNRAEQPEEEGSISFSFANLFRCMCCTYPKPDPANLQMMKVEMALEKINNEVKNLQVQVDAKIGRPSAMRRRSVHVLKKELNLNTLEEEEEENSVAIDDSSDDQQSIAEEHTYNQVDDHKEYWLSDPSLKNSPTKRLTVIEKDFWRELIDTYLYPLPDDPEEKAKISRQLIDLRNKVVFGVLMLNSMFILIVFLLQMKKDILHIEWPLNGKNKNITYLYSLNEIRIDMEYLQLEPINLVLVFFFTLILAIQFVAMIFHRSETLSHILASTNLFTLKSKGTKEINFSKLTDLLQKQGLNDDDDESVQEVNKVMEPTTVPDHPNSASPIPSTLHENVPVKKFRSLSLALEQDLVKILNKDPKFARAVKRKSKCPDALQVLRNRVALYNQGINSSRDTTRPPTPGGSMMDTDSLDFQWSNQGSIRRNKLLHTVSDCYDSESITSIQMANLPSSIHSTPNEHIRKKLSPLVINSQKSTQRKDNV